MVKNAGPLDAQARFALLRKAAPNASKFLDDLERRADSLEPGIERELRSFVEGLAGSGAITDNERLAILATLRVLKPSQAMFLDLFFAGACLILLLTASLSAQEFGKPGLLKGIAMVLSSAVAAIWALTRPWFDLPRWISRKTWLLPGRAALGSILGILVLVLFFKVVEAAVERSQKEFAAQREVFLNDPHGFPWLRRIAREEYGVDVVLGDVSESWALTTLDIPSASPASMATGYGFCVLNMSSQKLLRELPPPTVSVSPLWIQGVMVHEFAHCLDGLRDYKAFTQGLISANSIAPVDRPRVNDVLSFLEAQRTSSTLLWRESLADIMAIQFWKLSVPAQATNLIAKLREQRLKSQSSDPSHATMCWIDHAAGAEVPASNEQLFESADRLRSSALCNQMISKRTY